jgi:hypothetical protein
MASGKKLLPLESSISAVGTWTNRCFRLLALMCGFGVRLAPGFRRAGQTLISGLAYFIGITRGHFSPGHSNALAAFL